MALKRGGNKLQETNASLSNQLIYKYKSLIFIKAVLVRTIPSSMHRIKPKMITRQDY